MFSFADPAGPESISPELVLVSPELSAVARAGLPDRPWESFYRPADAAPLRPPFVAQAQVRVAEEAPAVDAAVDRHRSSVPIGLLLLAAFVGLIAAGSVLPVRDAPTLGPPPARANGVSTSQAPSDTPRVPIVPAPATVPAVPTPTTTTTTARVPERVNLVPRHSTARLVSTAHLVHSQARPQGGYVLGRGLGVLRVGAGAQSIAEIRTNIGCGWEVVTRRISIAADGRFSAKRVVRGQVRSTVSISGVFARAGTVSGTIRVTRGRCVGGPISFSGRLT